MAIAWKTTARFGPPEVFAVIGALSLVAARFLPVLDVGYACPFRSITGLPCATCGMTHAFVRLAHGEVRAALRASPFGAALAAGAWAYAALDLARAALGAPFPAIPERAVRLAAAAAVAALLVNWGYLLLSGGGAR